MRKRSQSETEGRVKYPDLGLLTEGTSQAASPIPVGGKFRGTTRILRQNLPLEANFMRQLGFCAASRMLRLRYNQRRQTNTESEYREHHRLPGSK